MLRSSASNRPAARAGDARPFRRLATVCHALLALALLIPSEAAAQSGGTAAGEWPSYGGEKSGTKYSPLDQINRDNVGRLRVAWRQSALPEPIRQAHGVGPGFEVRKNWQNTPLMVGGLLYIHTALGTAAALDPGTGEVVWFDKAPEGRAPARPNAGVAYWTDGRDARILSVNGDYLVAVNALTGARYPDFGKGGEVDLTVGFSRPVTSFSWGWPPVVVGDVVVVGGRGGGGGTAGDGDVRGYDVRTGELRWTFHTIPEPGEFGSETWLDESWAHTGKTYVWSWMTADEELGYVYLPISTPDNDWYGGHRHGDGLFAESIVALDAATGKRVWHYQIVRHGLWDYDLATPPVLVDIEVGGTTVAALAQPTKMSMLFVLDRRTGLPIWRIEDRPVPASTAPGERAAETQPFPLNGRGELLAYDQVAVTADDFMDYSPELRQEALRIANQYLWGPTYLPPVVPGVGAGEGKMGTIQMPGSAGGTAWNGAAFDPETGILYVPSKHSPIFVDLIPAPEDRPYDYMRRRYVFANGPQGLPLFKPPYGRLAAINLNNDGLVEWMIPVGEGPRDHPALADLGLPWLGQPGRPSPLVTKTLLFLGDGAPVQLNVPPLSGSKKFRAYDKATGEVLAEIELDGGTTGAPMTYMWEGKQYILVAIGWDDLPGEYVALALD